MADKIKIHVLEDGTIKVETDAVSMPNHMNAESFLKNMFTLAGGAITRKLKHGVLHAFGHDHKHTDESAHQ